MSIGPLLSTPYAESTNNQKAWLRTPLEVWEHIFNYVAALPHVAKNASEGEVNPIQFSDVFMDPRQLHKVEILVQRSNRDRITMANVCRTWCCLNLPRIYERVYLMNAASITNFASVLGRKGSMARNGSSYGSLTRHLYWKVHPAPDGKCPPYVVRAMVEIVQRTPNLHVFSPSPDVEGPGLPSEIIGVLVEHNLRLPLRCLFLNGPAEISDMVQLFRHTPHLTRLSVGWHALGDLCDTQSLSNLTALRVELSYYYFFAPSEVWQLTLGALPSLKQLFFVFQYTDSSPIAQRFLSMHGSKLEVLGLEMANTFRGNIVDLASYITHCPNLKCLVFDAGKFEIGAMQLGLVPLIRKLGLTNFSPVIQKVEERSGYFAMWAEAWLPSTLEIVKLLDIDAHFLPTAKLGVVRQLFTTWRLAGVRVEDMNGVDIWCPSIRRCSVLSMRRNSFVSTSQY